MPKFTLLLMTLFSCLVSFGQNISVTFAGTGAATRIDSITATNLSTNESITLPGNETLVLGANTGIPAVSELTNRGMVFPNPFMGQATFTTIVQNPQTAYLKLQNLVGQIVAQTKAFIQPGENEFVLSVNTAGIYMVSLTTDRGTSSYKIICSESNTLDNSIQYLGSVPDNHNNHNNHNNYPPSDLKTSLTSYTLGYVEGDIILYRCMSGIYTTIVTDSPASSKNYEVKFAGCTDPDGKNYSIVPIGSQIWMAENLAFLPDVSPPSAGSEDSPLYYVYDYVGNNVSEAKATANYSTYGALYNWTAVMNGTSSGLENPSGIQGICPNGWHLPSQAEWVVLDDYLGMAGGSKMKESGTIHWESPNEGATNASGFTALPGGHRYPAGKFGSLGEYAFFWSTTSNATSTAWMQVLYYDFETVNWSNYFRPGGNSVRCILGQGSPGLAILTTKEITAISDTTASSGGSITSNWGAAITARGICWNTAEIPTISNSKTTDGSGAGAFSSTLTGLRSGTVYFVRAYAVNSVGTAYGEQKQFKTSGAGDDHTFEYDGRIYNFKTIGTQTWMTENLAYLPAVSPSSGGSEATPYYYVYGYEGSNVSDAKNTNNYKTYGVLYNWPASLTACPPGWHLPTDTEWNTLTTYLGGEGIAGGKMKETGTAHWLSPNTGATNTSGFTALGGGYRSTEGAYYDGFGQYGIFWSTLPGSESRAVYYYMFNNSGGVSWELDYRRIGVSVRCIRN